MEAVHSEEKHCCGQIDARVNKLRDERIALGEEYAAVEKQLKTELGLIARIAQPQISWRSGPAEGKH
jgi:hypothetical protein